MTTPDIGNGHAEARYTVRNQYGVLHWTTNDYQWASDRACDLIKRCNEAAIIHDNAPDRAFPWTVYKRERWLGLGYSGTQYSTAEEALRAVGNIMAESWS